MSNEDLSFHYTQHTTLFMIYCYTDSVWSVKGSLEGYDLPDEDKSLGIYNHWSRKLSLQDLLSLSWAFCSGMSARLCPTESCTSKLLEGCSCAQMVPLDAEGPCTDTVLAHICFLRGRKSFYKSLVSTRCVSYWCWKQSPGVIRHLLSLKGKRYLSCSWGTSVHHYQWGQLMKENLAQSSSTRVRAFICQLDLQISNS